MKIISGSLRGIEIPFVNEKFDNANTTPQKVKKALFSIIGERLPGRSFLDLYACSGQVGVEAISRGASPVIFSEIDHKRYQFIKSLIAAWNLKENALVLNYHAFRCMRFLESKDIKMDFIYIDAPYPKDRKNTEPYDHIMNELLKYDILKQNGKIIIQHLSKSLLQIDPDSYRHISTKEYAKNALSIYKKQDNQ
ncbi:MAG: RsmD family RNA methyltransferase [Spirochaetes bacterium]|nr:RsmD family RNA methyltransferase [Spirochaetota bacterium]